MSKSDTIRSKIIALPLLQKKLNLWRFQRQKIVFTNGCFDILHLGHVHLLSKAADFGDILVVALNSDASVRNLKGINRPLQDETTRASIIASLFYVKAVVLFDEDTPIELIKMISPDVLVKGGDYSIENIVGSEWVTRQGGRVEIVPLLKGYSSSDLVNRITIERENYNITQKP